MRNAWPNQVRIRFEHLSPAVQAIIKRPKGDSFSPDSKKATIREARIARALFDGLTLATVGAGSFGWIMGSPPAVGVAGIYVGYNFTRRIKYAKKTNRLHEKLIETMSTYGVIAPKFEEEYGERWMNPADIAESYPIFHVEPNGDLVFHRNSRAEYLKWMVQRKLYTSTGWWWRAYLKPPKAPESVKEWAKRKLKKTSTAIEREPAYCPVPVRRR
jgi:hypothetical protein